MTDAPHNPDFPSVRGKVAQDASHDPLARPQESQDFGSTLDFTGVRTGRGQGDESTIVMGPGASTTPSGDSAQKRRGKSLPRGLLRAVRWITAVGLIVGIVLGLIWRRQSILAEADRLEKVLREQLAPPDWTHQHLAALEPEIRKLQELDQTRGDELWEQALDAFFQDEQLELEQPAFGLDEGALRNFQENQKALAAHSKERGAALQKRYQQRLHRWSRAVDLRAPFNVEQISKLFPTGADVVLSQGVLRRGATLRPGVSGDPESVYCTQGGQGIEKVEVQFGSDWVNAGRLGVYLHADDFQYGAIHAAALTGDQRHLAISSQQQPFVIWNVPRQTRRVIPLETPVTDLHGTAQGRFYGVHRQQLLRWNAETGAAEAIDVPDNEGITCFALHDDRLAALGDQTGQIRLWDLQAQELQATFQAEGATAALRDIVFSRDGIRLASLDAANQAIVWDVASKKPMMGPINMSSRPPRQIVFLADGSRLQTDHPDLSQIHLWDVQQGGHVRGRHYDFAALKGEAFAAGSSPISVHPDDRRWLKGARQSEVDSDGFGIIVPFSAALGSWSFYAPDGIRALNIQRDGEVQILNLETERVDAVLAPHWYELRVSAISSQEESAASVDDPATFARRIADGREVYLQLYRDGACLRETQAAVAEGPLRLTLSRQGDELVAQVNQQEQFRFVDAFPLPELTGAVGLRWPASVSVLELQAYRKTAAARPGLTEQADQLASQGRYREALAAYTKQRQAAEKAPAFADQLACKMARCHLQLDETPQALKLLEEVAAQPESAWRQVANFGLWIGRLQAGNLLDAETAAAGLAQEYPGDELLDCVPPAVLWNLIADYVDIQKSSDGITRTALRDHHSSALLRAKKLADYLRAETSAKCYFYIGLLRHYQFHGMLEEAAALATQFFHEEMFAQWTQWNTDESSQLLYGLFDRYTWLQIERGQPREALDQIDRLVRQEQYGVRRRVVFSLNRSRLLIALNQWDQAERELDRAIEVIDEDLSGIPYEWYSEVYLLRGYVHQHFDRQENTLADWREAGWKRWHQRQGLPMTSPIPEDSSTHGWESLIHHLFSAAYTGQLSDQECEAAMDRLLKNFGKSPMVIAAVIILKDKTLLRSMWLHPRGEQAARDYVLRRLSLRKALDAPLVLLATEIVRTEGFEEEMSAAEEQISVDLFGNVVDLIRQDQLEMAELMQLGLAWKGMAAIDNWGATKEKLPQEVRGPTSYFFGHRYLRLAKPQLAEQFFKYALEDASQDSDLHRLARNALAQLEDGTVSDPLRTGSDVATSSH